MPGSALDNECRHEQTTIEVDESGQVYQDLSAAWVTNQATLKEIVDS